MKAAIQPMRSPVTSGRAPGGVTGAVTTDEAVSMDKVS
jgi:hypothetical protein